MTNDDKVRDEKRQYDINREAAKISALSFEKIGKYEYLTSEEILPSNQRQIIEQTKFYHSKIFSIRKSKQKTKKKKSVWKANKSNWRASKEKNRGCYYKSKLKAVSFNQ